MNEPKIDMKILALIQKKKKFHELQKYKIFVFQFYKKKKTIFFSFQKRSILLTIIFVSKLRYPSFSLHIFFD